MLVVLVLPDVWLREQSPVFMPEKRLRTQPQLLTPAEYPPGMLPVLLLSLCPQLTEIPI